MGLQKIICGKAHGFRHNSNHHPRIQQMEQPKLHIAHCSPLYNYIFDCVNYWKFFHLCGWKIEQCNRLKIKILYTI